MKLITVPKIALWPAAWRAAAVLGLAGTLNAQTILRSGHMDLGVAYEAGELVLHLHSHEPEPDGTEYGPGEAIVEVGLAGQTTVPANPLFSFLGAPGDTVYLLPATENPALPFLGLAAEEVPLGLFQGDVLTLTLTGVSGPGEFALFTVDAFGVPSVLMNTRDGLDAGDKTSLLAGSHAHANWAFSASGDYELTFVASGTLVGGGAISSEAGTFRFTVVPEPLPGVLLVLGTVLLLGHRRRCANESQRSRGWGEVSLPGRTG